MKIKDKFISFILAVTLTVPLFISPAEVHADNAIIHAKNGIEHATNSFSWELDEFLGRFAEDKETYEYSLMISTLKADGLSTNAIAGIIGNISCESSGQIYTLEGYYPASKKTTDGTHYKDFQDGKTYDYGDVKPATYKYKGGGEIGGVGHGIVGWSFERADNLSKFAEKYSDFGRVTVTHWKISKQDPTWKQETCYIPNMAGQVAFMAQELNDSYKSVKEKLNKASSAKDAAKIFMDDYEKPATATLSERQSAAEKAVAMIEKCSGVEGSVADSAGQGSDKDGINDTTAIMNAMSGYWTEDQLSAFCRLSEANIQRDYLDEATLDKLSQTDLEGLYHWKNTVNMNKKENGFIAFLRIVVMFLGIILTIYSLFIYLAYWFDKLNSLIDIDVLSIITFGRLHVAIDEKEANYSLSHRNGDHVTVSHKDILFICITGLIFGTLLITGTFYKWVSILVLFIRQRLGLKF